MVLGISLKSHGCDFEYGSIIARLNEFLLVTNAFVSRLTINVEELMISLASTKARHVSSLSLEDCEDWEFQYQAKTPQHALH